MNTCRKYLLAAGVALLSALAFSAQHPPAKTAPVVVIVNQENPITSLSKMELHKIFAGDKSTWSNGLPIVPYIRSAPAHERDVLLDAVMKMTDMQYQEYWVKKIYSGQSVREPLALPTSGMIMEAVRSQKGGIALVNVGEVKSGVKVIPVEDLFPVSH